MTSIFLPLLSSLTLALEMCFLICIHHKWMNAHSLRTFLCTIFYSVKSGLYNVNFAFSFSMSSPVNTWMNGDASRSEEHTSELQSRFDLVCRLLLEKKNN